MIGRFQQNSCDFQSEMRIISLLDEKHFNEIVRKLNIFLIAYHSSFGCQTLQYISIMILNLNFIIQKHRFFIFFQLKAKPAIISQLNFQEPPTLFLKTCISQCNNMWFPNNKIIDGFLQINRSVGNR